MPHTCDKCHRTIKGTHDDPATFVFTRDQEFRGCKYCDRVQALWKKAEDAVGNGQTDPMTTGYLDTLKKSHLIELAKHIGYQPVGPGKPSRDELTEAIQDGTHEDHKLTKETLGCEYTTTTICRHCNTVPVTRL